MGKPQFINDETDYFINLADFRTSPTQSESSKKFSRFSKQTRKEKKNSLIKYKFSN